MNSKFLEELRQKYIQPLPEGMTARLVRNMSDSDLLDMHEFLTEDDNLDDDELKVFILTSFNHRLFALPAFCGLLSSDGRHLANFPIIQKKRGALLRFFF